MPLDPYEQLTNLFGDIADAIRDHEGGEPQYEEVVTNDASELQNILEDNTGERLGSSSLAYLRSKYPRRCLMTDAIEKNYGSYFEDCLFIFSSPSTDLYNENISITSYNDEYIIVSNNNSFDIVVIGYKTNNDRWSTVVESATTISAGTSKTYNGYFAGNLNLFSNTVMIQAPTEISAQDFARRISPTSAPSGNVTSLNALFTNIANAIRNEAPDPPIYEAPNGKMYRHKYIYQARHSSEGIVGKVECYTNYRIAALKNGQCYYEDTRVVGYLPTITVNLPSSGTAPVSKTKENFLYNSAGDYFIITRVSGSSAFYDDYEMPLQGPEAITNWEIISSDFPAYDTMEDIENYIYADIDTSSIAPSNMPTLIRNL